MNKRQALAAARQHFLRALSFDPDYVPALNNLGNVAMASANYDEAVKHFTAVLTQDSKFVPAYGNLAIIYSLQGQNAEAKKYLSRAFEIEPDNARLKSMMAQIAKSGSSL